MLELPFNKCIKAANFGCIFMSSTLSVKLSTKTMIALRRSESREPYQVLEDKCEALVSVNNVV